MTRTEHGPRGTLDNGGSARSSSSRDPRSQPAQQLRRERRSQPEPLAASWDPHAERRKEQRERRKPKKAGVAGTIATYGWRIYALPILVVLTVLAFVDSGAEPVPDQQAAGGTQTSENGEPVERQPVVAEAPPGKIDVNIPSAELPKGDEFVDAGPNTFTVVRGSGPVVGTGGKLYRYTIEVEQAIDLTKVGGEDAFGKTVDNILSSEKSWTKQGTIKLQRVDTNSPKPDFRISLTTPGTVRRPDVCNYTIQYEASCWNQARERVYINLGRWIRGAVVFEGDLGRYRQYAINHEVGHVFDNPHKGCSANGELAPVMMQQSFGVANDYVAELNKGDSGNRNAVKADGKVCKPNPWPFP